MSFSDDFIEEIKLKNDIIDIISSYTPLKKRGKNFVGLCPFHSEKTASFNVYPQSSSFYCFGCGIGGDVITFIEKIESFTYIESVNFLAQRVGIQIPEMDKNDDKILREKTQILAINREMAMFFYKNLYLDSGRIALNYLYDRGLSDKTIKHFGLGYAPKSKYDIINYLVSKGFKHDEIVNANLAYNGNNKNISARFVDRIMFPIIDLKGNVIAFGGRTMSDKKPKYLNTSDTLVFKKSLNLFALNFAKKSNSKTLILVEGYMDVISLHQAGLQNVVATLGTALTPEQVCLISRLAKEVIICYDSDESGQKASSRAINLFRQADILIKVITIPNGKDPDEFVNIYGKESLVKFKQLIKNSENDIEYQLLKMSQDYNLETSDGKISYLNKSVKFLANLDNLIEREIYSGVLSKKLNVSKETIKLQISKECKKQNKLKNKKYFFKIKQNLFAKNNKLDSENFRNLKSVTAEEAVIAYIINNPKKSSLIFSRLSVQNFCTSFNRKIYSILCSKIKNSNPISFTILAQNFSLEETSNLAAILAKQSEKMLTEEDINEYLKIILYESNKLNEKTILEAKNDKIMEYMYLLKESKK